MIFFVLSGFVIEWSTGRYERTGGEPFGRYFLKRFVRIYSVWACAMVALCLISLLEQGRFVHQPAGQWLGNLLMLQDWRHGHPATICDPLYGDTPLWSLHYEWWFYMLYPAVNACGSRSARVHVVGVLAFANAVLYALNPNPVGRLFVYLSVWWIGVHAAHRLRESGAVHGGDLVLPLGYVIVAAIPGVIVAVRWWASGGYLSPGTHPVVEPRHLLGAVALVIVACAWRRTGWLAFAPTIGRCAVVAPISFSLYVIHYRSLGVATYFSFVGSRWLEMALYALATVVFCYVSEVVCYPRLRRLLLTSRAGVSA